MSVFSILPWKIAPSGSSDFIRSVGEDLILVKDASVEELLDHPFKTESFVLLLCSQGSLEGLVNMVPRSICGASILVLYPGQVIQFKQVSRDFKMHLVIASKSLLAKLDIRLTAVLPLRFILKVKEMPIVQLRREETKVVVSIFDLMYQLARNEGNPYRELALLNVIRAFCYEAGYYLVRNEPELHLPEQPPVMERLLPLIKRHFRQHREVDFYAKRMGLSPNYLYKVVMAASGKSVRSWIEEYVVTEAKTLLRNTNLTVQQISLELNFPSQTFFGKYFRRLTGMSPSEYRKR